MWTMPNSQLAQNSLSQPQNTNFNLLKNAIWTRGQIHRLLAFENAALEQINFESLIILLKAVKRTHC